MPSIRLFLLALLLATPSMGGDLDGQLLEAARSGELSEVHRLLDAGASVNAADRWGTTALAAAVAKGHAEVVEALLLAGADPNLHETFFDTSPLDLALGAMGEPRIDLALRLLRAGAEDRASALEVALSVGNVELARVAVQSGPLYASEAAALRTRFAGVEGELGSILARAATQPDPPPPAYTPAELEAFTGRFEGWESDVDLSVKLEGGHLVLSIPGESVRRLTTTAKRTFRSADGEIAATYFGRAGMVEGLALERSGSEPITLRRSVAEPTPDAARSDEPAGRSPATVAHTVQWPGFRGANAAGIGDGEDTPLDWNLDSGTNVAWVVDLPGIGNSSPVVWGDRVFVTTAVAEGDQQGIRTGLTGAGTEVEEATEHRWLVLAFDKTNGKRLWQTEVGRGVPLTRRHFKATQANSTPATDGRHLVVVFPTAGLACLGLDGSIHWRHELGGLNAGGFNDPTLQWGFASSPLIFEDRVILQVDIHDGPYLAAWELESGRRLWRTERPDVAPSWATPVLWRTPDGTEVVTNASTIHGYDPADGKVLWSLEPNSVQVVATPVVGAATVYVSAGYPPVKPIYALRPGVRGRLELEPGREHPMLRWSHERGGAYMPTPLLYRGLLYVVHHNGRLVAYDAATGAALYKARFSRGGTFTNSPVAANGTIYQGTEDGLLYVLAAGPEYDELAVRDFGEPLMATPAISEGALFVRTPSRLIALRQSPVP